MNTQEMITVTMPRNIAESVAQLLKNKWSALEEECQTVRALKSSTRQEIEVKSNAADEAFAAWRAFAEQLGK